MPFTYTALTTFTHSKTAKWIAVFLTELIDYQIYMFDSI